MTEQTVSSLGYFTKEMALKDGYDARIDEVDWKKYFIACLMFWVAVSVAGRTVLPKPGPYKKFLKEGNLHDFKFFQS